MESFREYLEAEGLQPRTIETYLRVGNRVWERDPRAWLRQQLAQAPAGTACVYKAAVRHWAEWMGLSPIKMPRGKRRQRKYRRPLDKNQLQSWYLELESVGDPARVVLEILPRTGMRVSEACSLRNACLAADEGGFGVQIEGKGGHERWIPFSSGAVDCLERFLDMPLEAYMELDHESEWLFPGKKNQAISTTWLQEVARNIGKRMGTATNPHVLRHTWASRAHRAGVPATEIQAVLGHSSPSTTAIYIHSDAELMRRAIDAVEEMD